MGAARGGRARQPDRHRRRVLDGRRRRAAGGDRRAGAPLRRARDGGRGARDGRAGPGWPRQRRGGGAAGRGRRDRRDARQGARVLRRIRVLRHGDEALPREHRAHADLLHRPGPAGRRGARSRRSTSCANSRTASSGWRATHARCARRSRARDSTSLTARRRSCRSWSATPTPRWRSASACCAPECSPRRSGRRPCRRARRGCASPRWRPTTPAELRRAAGALAAAFDKVGAAVEPEPRARRLRLCRLALRPRAALFVTGTDTEVGKTVVACAIAATLARTRRARVGLQAGGHRARRARRHGRRPRAPARRGALVADAVRGRALPLRPAGVAAPGGRSCRRARGSRPAASPPRTAPPQPATCSSPRASAACWFRCPAPTWCATSPPTSACRS